MKTKNEDFLTELMSKMSKLNNKSVAADLMARAPDDTVAVEKMLAETVAELDTMNEELDMELDIEDADMMELPPCDAPAPAAASRPTPHSVTGSEHITIRLCSRVLAAYRMRARATGTKYQTLINRTLLSSMASWKTPGSHL